MVIGSPDIPHVLVGFFDDSCALLCNVVLPGVVQANAHQIHRVAQLVMQLLNCSSEEHGAQEGTLLDTALLPACADGTVAGGKAQVVSAAWTDMCEGMVPWLQG